MAKQRVLFLCGGKSTEHEISLISTHCVLSALDREKFIPIVVGISKKGIWHLEEEKNFYTGAVRADQIQLNENTPTVQLQPFLSTNRTGALFVEGKAIPFDVVFPLIHGQYGEDGKLQGLLDMIGIPYVGTGNEGSHICMDKALAKAICIQANILVTDHVVLYDFKEIEEKKQEIARLGFPLFVKPVAQGSSVGIHKVNQMQELTAAVQDALCYDQKCLIEKAVFGREIECAVLGSNRRARASLPGEIIINPKVGWYSYEAKYLLSDAAEVITPAALSPKLCSEIQALAIQVFSILECDGMARVDFFLEKETDRVFLNEVNTIPGFTPISMYPKMWAASGIAYSALITELIQLAMEKLGKREGSL